MKRAHGFSAGPRLLHALLAAMALLLTSAAYAQTCSGGAGGGMDATGCDCNLAIGTGAAAALVQAESPATTGRYHFERALDEYEKGHYANAVRLFEEAAESGDARAAEVLAIMYRFGRQLFGDSIRSDRAEAAHFAELAIRLRGDVSAVEQAAP